MAGPAGFRRASQGLLQLSPVQILVFAWLQPCLLGLHVSGPPSRNKVAEVADAAEELPDEEVVSAEPGGIDRLAQGYGYGDKDQDGDVVDEGGDPSSVMRQMLATLQPKMYHLHVPVTAGDSLNADSDFFGIPSWKFRHGSREGCYSWRKYFPEKHRAITMLRDPRSHVLGQYMHCRYSTSSQYRMRHHNDVPASFEAWVHDWAAWRANRSSSSSAGAVWHEKDQPYPCYSPIEMQTHRLTCERPSQLHLDLDLAEASENMRATEFVGILEAYHESLCVFRAKLGKALPPGCNCSNATAWHEVKFKHAAHGVPPHSIKNYSASTLAEVDSLTTADRALYRAAVERFLEDVAAVEASHGVKVMCRDLRPE